MIPTGSSNHRAPVVIVMAGQHTESKDPNTRVIRPKYHECEWYLGPKAPLFGSLDPYGMILYTAALVSSYKLIMS